MKFRWDSSRRDGWSHRESARLDNGYWNGSGRCWDDPRSSIRVAAAGDDTNASGRGDWTESGRVDWDSDGRLKASREEMKTGTDESTRHRLAWRQFGGAVRILFKII